MLHLPPLALSVVRLCLWLALLAAVFIPLERLFAVRRQKLARKALWSDLGYYFLNNLLPAAILVFPLSAVAWIAHHYVPYRLHIAMASMPTWARIVAILAVGEFGFYWAHRWSHQNRFLWRFHAVHHSAEEIDWLVNSRAHPFDMVFTRFFGLAPLMLLGLGLDQRAGQSPDPATLVVAIIGTVWVFFIHANVRWRFGWLEWVVSTPGFHHWHHTNDEHRDKNFASFLPVMDILFGTYHAPRRAWPERYGIDAPMAPGMAGQLIDPLLGAKRGAPATPPTDVLPQARSLVS
jgi:sterol desaturase/sphingolipid hydroxylase (fatty acid hydroxylase superfamily)